ncbi:MAG: TOBE domain-containing protein [Sulfurospirillaceae bacterium]|nr:TOBE domain-containing protein [Sulfurospirillaceae bacterium]
MNRLHAVVTDVVGEQNLHIISFDFQGSSLSMMGLDLPFGLHVGSSVVLGAKPSHLAIGKNIQGKLSYSNQLDATIVSIENGKLLSSIILHVKDVMLQSFITCKSSQRMNLQVGDEVKLLIKASELFVLEVNDA